MEKVEKIKRKRILLMSDGYGIQTGFSCVGKHIADWLHQTGKYEVAYLSWFHNHALKIQAPFVQYTTLKNHDGCCKRGKLIEKYEPGKAPRYFQIVNKIYLNELGGGACESNGVEGNDKYAFESLAPIINDFEPEIIWTLGDIWMTFHTQFMPNKDSFKWISYIPSDGHPVPHLTRQGNQEINWPLTLKNADVSVAYCEWAMRGFNETSKKAEIKEDVCTKWIWHGCDTVNYKPIPADERNKFRKESMKLEDNTFLIGTFSRNQPRKAFHKLLEAIKLFKDKGYETDKKLVLYIHCPIWDVGWNLPELIRHYNLRDCVILNDKLQIGVGVSDEMLNTFYNACDLMTLPSRGEGFGLTYIEAMAAGIPTLMSAYSAHHNWAGEGAARIAIKSLDAEPVTNIERGIVDVDDYCDVLKLFYDNAPVKKYYEHVSKRFTRLVQFYNPEYDEKIVCYDKYTKIQKSIVDLADSLKDNDTPILEHFSKVGLDKSKEFVWGMINRQWEDLIDAVDVSKVKPYAKQEYRDKIRKPVILTDLLDKDPKDRILFTMPESAGDILISTGVLDSIKKKYPTKDIYFATKEMYFPMLEGNPNVHKTLPYNDVFLDYVTMQKLFEIVYTPHYYTQRYGNWTKNGHGPHLSEVYSSHCDVEWGDTFIGQKEVKNLPEKYVTIHNNSLQRPKNYDKWQTIVKAFKLPVLQIGGKEDPFIKGTIDKRGTTFQESAFIVKGSSLHLGVDSFPAHLAAHCNVPTLLVFGSTFPQCTGPRYKEGDKDKFHYLEPADRMGCDKACHLLECYRRKESGCVVNITPQNVVDEANKILGNEFIGEIPKSEISGYTTSLNPEGRYPYTQSIESMLAFCDEIVVVDGHSTDGSYEKLKEWEKTEPKLKIYRRKFRMNEPAMDGMQKAYARALCTKEFLWQQDIDEVVHQDDPDKIHQLIKEFPSTVDILTLPVIDLIGNETRVKGDSGLHKWRLSRNKPNITHGIHKAARKKDTKTGKTYADKSKSDGCEYIDANTLQVLNHAMFAPGQFFALQNTNYEEYCKGMNELFKKWPKVFHYSWADLKRRLKVNLDFWWEQWRVLDTATRDQGYNPLFPDTKFEDITDEMIEEKARWLYDHNEDGSDRKVFDLHSDITQPKYMKDWIEKEAFLQYEKQSKSVAQV